MASSSSPDTRKRKKVSFALPPEDGNDAAPTSKRARQASSTEVDSDEEDSGKRGKLPVREATSAEDGEEEYSAKDLDSLQRSSKEEQVPIIPFNLKADRETGYFDTNGSYVWQRRDAGEPKEESDAWLDSVDEAKGALLYKGKAAEEINTAPSPKRSRVEALYEVYMLLDRPDETVLQAVQRYGRKGADGKAVKEHIAKLERLSSAASALLEDIPTVYEETKRKIRGMIKPQLDAKMGQVKWQYKLSLDNAEVHGPYTSFEMQQWKDAGYFIGDNAAYVRRFSSAASSSSSSSTAAEAKQEKNDLKADLMDDSESDDERPVADASTDWIRSDQVDFEAVTMSGE